MSSLTPHPHYSVHPPRWLWRGLVMTAAVVVGTIFIWRTMGLLTGLITNLVIALFISLTIEPMVRWLVQHGWKRGAATGAVMLTSLLAIAGMFAMFGKLFVDQAMDLVRSAPDIYESLREFALERFKTELPEESELVNQLVQEWGTDVTSRVLDLGSSVLGFIFNAAMIGLVLYYLTAAGPRFRASICAWLAPKNQAVVLELWEVTQTKVSDFINSRVVLAGLSAAFTFVFLTIIQVPYALPLALFTGIVSQFVPTIGTYIGGALPILLTLSESWVKSVAVLVFIVLYQQVENYWFSPKISERALSMNPAVAFIVVIGFGAVFGPLGAFLGLPVAATIQAIATTYLRRHELIDSALLRDDEVPGDDPERTAAARAALDDDATTGRGSAQDS